MVRLFHSTPDLSFSPDPPLPPTHRYPYLLPTATPTSYPALPPPTNLLLPTTYPYNLPTYPTYLPTHPYPYHLPTPIYLPPPTLPPIPPTYPPTLTSYLPLPCSPIFCYFVSYLSLPLPFIASTFFDHLFFNCLHMYL